MHPQGDASGEDPPPESRAAILSPAFNRAAILSPAFNRARHSLATRTGRNEPHA